MESALTGSCLVEPDWANASVFALAHLAQAGDEHAKQELARRKAEAAKKDKA